MKCPHCKQQIDLPNRSYANVEVYRPYNALASTLCCGKLVSLRRIIFFEISPYNSGKLGMIREY